MARVFPPLTSEGVGKRAREDDHEVEHRLTRDRLRGGSSYDTELAFQHHRGFLSSIKTKSSDDISDDATSTDSNMDVEDDAIDEKDITHYTGKSALQLNTTVKIDVDSQYELKSDAVDAFFHTMKGGKLQYVRKIDFLVDDLVRKTNRTLNWAGGSASELCCIPSSIGPHPATDMRFLSTVAEVNDSETYGDSYEERGKKSHSSSEKVDFSAPSPGAYVSDPGLHNNVLLPTRSSKLSGDLSHCDWPIEEISG